MMNHEIQKSIKQCALCWLATVNADGVPNVSPKEMFVSDGDNHLLIADMNGIRLEILCYYSRALVSNRGQA